MLFATREQNCQSKRPLVVDAAKAPGAAMLQEIAHVRSLVCCSWSSWSADLSLCHRCRSWSSLEPPAISTGLLPAAGPSKWQPLSWPAREDGFVCEAPSLVLQELAKSWQSCVRLPA